MSSFTPGPWSFETEWDGNSIIAQVAKPGKAIYVVGPNKAMRTTGEGTANARLIAAATDLLEFAKAFAETYVAAGGMPFDEETLIEMCRAAIAKAEGRS